MGVEATMGVAATMGAAATEGQQQQWGRHGQQHAAIAVHSSSKVTDDDGVDTALLAVVCSRGGDDASSLVLSCS